MQHFLNKKLLFDWEKRPIESVTTYLWLKILADIEEYLAKLQSLLSTALVTHIFTHTESAL